MTLPNAPLSAGPGGSVATSTAPSAPPIATSQNTPVSPLPDPGHVDYNLQPLKVASLDHYIEPPAGDVRFRVS